MESELFWYASGNLKTSQHSQVANDNAFKAGRHRMPIDDDAAQWVGMVPQLLRGGMKHVDVF